jgi:hypothetical protein
MVEIMITNKKKSWPQVFRDGCEGAKLTLMWFGYLLWQVGGSAAPFDRFKIVRPFKWQV